MRGDTYKLLLSLLTCASVCLAEPPEGSLQIEPVNVSAESISKKLDAVRKENPNIPVAIFCITEADGPTPEDCDKLKEELGAISTLAAEPVTQVELVDESKPASTMPKRRGPWELAYWAWNGFFAVVRGGTSYGAMATVVIVSKGADPEAAQKVAERAAEWAAAMQLLNYWRLNWLAHKSWFKFSQPGEHEKAGHKLRIVKRVLQSALYGALTTYSFYEAGLNPNPVALASAAMLLLSTAESTVIQTPWDAYNQHKTQTAISARPERVRRYLVLSSLGSLALSFANVTAVGLNIGGGIYGTLLSAVVGTGGWYVWGKESGLKVPQSVLELRDRLARSGKTAVQTCRGLLSQLF